MVRSLTRVNLEPTANLTHFTYTLRPDTTKEKQQLIANSNSPKAEQEWLVQHQPCHPPLFGGCTNPCGKKYSPKTPSLSDSCLMRGLLPQRVTLKDFCSEKMAISSRVDS